MRTALVTGGSRGIGKAIATELYARNWQLFLVAQDPEHLAAAKADFANAVGTFAVDLGAGAAAADSVSEAFASDSASLDLLVLGAGIFIEESLSAVDENTFRRNMAVNLDANVFLVKALLPSLSRGTKPRIIIIGSTAAYEPYPLVPTYGIAKWALRGFAQNLRHELQGSRIGVSFVSPGGTLTDMWAGVDLAPNRLLDPHDIAIIVATIPELSEQAVVDEVIVRPILGDIHE
ncbi:MAG TPA: SDR family oxidoreductase [Gemmatimonadales bacterium]|jgi:NAD(P)-dependent dehydrogenase (short-subunit alcohol dehydrogenase family)